MRCRTRISPEHEIPQFQATCTSTVPPDSCPRVPLLLTFTPSNIEGSTMNLAIPCPEQSRGMYPEQSRGMYPEQSRGPVRHSLSFCRSGLPFYRTPRFANPISSLTTHSPRPSRAHPPSATTFRINTCKSVTKQKTLTACRINTYAKHRGRGAGRRDDLPIPGDGMHQVYAGQICGYEIPPEIRPTRP